MSEFEQGQSAYWRGNPSYPEWWYGTIIAVHNGFAWIAAHGMSRRCGAWTTTWGSPAYGRQRSVIAEQPFSIALQRLRHAPPDGCPTYAITGSEIAADA